MPVIAPFTPRFILESELEAYGLPPATKFRDILGLVDFASAFLDEECGRIDGEGSGSLIFTTYTQRILLQTRNRNLLQIPLKPIVAVDQSTVDELIVAATGSDVPFNPFYTGVQVNTLLRPTGELSGIISASGRYGYTRQDMAAGYPDYFTQINPLNLVTLYGGPAPWVPIDVTLIDYDPKTGEAWIPAGLQLARYSEVMLTYNSGYNPMQLPYVLKHVTASMVKNLMAKGNATTAMMNMRLGRSGANAEFYQTILDPTLDRMLTAYRVVRSY